MRYTRIIAIILVLIICFHISALAAESKPDATIANGCRSLDASMTYLGTKSISPNIDSAIVYETNSSTLMYALNADEKVYPSSLVKILTALIAVEKGNLQDIITVSQDVLDTVPYYAASAELVADEKITLSDLLYCMMVGSANDAAAVIATHISGSQNAFVKDMNAYANAVGCTGTQFVNVHGLHDEEQFTTTRDMAKILAKAVENDDFLTYFSAVHYNVPATNKSEIRELSSGNFLMNIDNLQIYQDTRVTGGRTGTTEDGARCLASLAEQDSMKLICIVTGSESTFTENGSTLTYGSFKETSALLDAAFDGNMVVQILFEKQALQQCQVANGKNDVVLGALSSVSSVLPANTGISDLSYRVKDDMSLLAAPISSGQIISTVEVWFGNLCVGQTELMAMNAVDTASVQQFVGNDIKNKTQPDITAIIIVSIVFGAILLFGLLRFSGKVRAYFTAQHNKRYRRSRRRSR